MVARGRRARRAAPSSRGRASSRRVVRSKRSALGPGLSVYEDMLAEAGPTDAQERPVKRRKRAGDVDTSTSEHEPRQELAPPGHVQIEEAESASDSDAAATPDLQPGLTVDPPDDEDKTSVASEAPSQKSSQQVVYDDTESSEDSDTDAAYERMILEGIRNSPDAHEKEKPDKETVVRVQISADISSRNAERKPRRHAKARDKAQRVDVHKVSLLLWLMHGHRRNNWCNNSTVQAEMRQMLSLKQASFFNPSSSLPQNEQSLLFQRGLEEATKTFRDEFKITNITAISFEEFLDAAQRLRGSVHTGNQLFCALIRAVGVEARLVCSLQVTKLSSAIAISDIDGESNKPSKTSAYSQVLYRPLHESDDEETSNARPKPIRRRLGRAASPQYSRPTRSTASTAADTSLRTFPESAHPFYWIEAFSVPNQRWLCVDPLVTKSWNKPRKLEPPLHDENNSMTYVVGFHNDLSARDVTRRYAKAYNAKTHRRRLESIAGGERWLKRVMKLFRRRHLEDNDQIEDAEFARLAAAEPMPNAQQDFKDHPVYALERHLHHNEVIEPRSDVGRVTIGKKQEPIFRRSHVHLVRSSDKWYRSFGRQIRIGEQPLKYGKPRRRKHLSPDDEGEEEDVVGVGLYAEHQTQLFVPQPVVDGKVIKNVYGNLDVYVPSMIPAGGAHVRCSDAVQAARLARVDYAEAVTGFQFKGRRGTAVTHGIIVAKMYYEAVEVICHGLREARRDAQAAEESKKALALWKRFLLGLRIRERVMANADPDAEEADIQQKVDDAEDEEEEIAGEGGFFLENNPLAESAPTKTKRDPSTHRVQSDEVDDAILAMNRDDGSSRTRRGPGPSREYFESTLFSPWDIPQREPSKDDPLDDKDPPMLISEFTNDSLFQDNDDPQDVDVAAGGGFLPDDSASNDFDHAQEGGFLRESRLSEPGDENQRPAQAPSPLKTGATEPEESSPHTVAHDISSNAETGTTLATIPAPTDEDTTKDSLLEPPPRSSNSRSATPTSLLSHDPEDDELEEGWLLAETDGPGAEE